MKFLCRDPLFPKELESKGVLDFEMSEMDRILGWFLYVERKKIVKLRIDLLREESGYFRSKDPLVCFLYDVMRDHLPVGVVEKLVLENVHGLDCLFSNGFLAKYAENLARELRK